MSNSIGVPPVVDWETCFGRIPAKLFGKSITRLALEGDSTTGPSGDACFGGLDESTLEGLGSKSGLVGAGTEEKYLCSNACCAVILFFWIQRKHL